LVIGCEEMHLRLSRARFVESVKEVWLEAIARNEVRYYAHKSPSIHICYQLLTYTL